MPLNWLSNLEFSKENPYKWNTKDLKTQQNEIRDLDRKRAIERSLAGSMDANGNFSETALRSNLIKEGFGEDADRITNEFTSARSKKADESLAQKERATNLYSQGIINKDEFDRLVGNEKKIVESSVETTKPTQTVSSETDWQDPSKDPESWKIARGETPTQASPNEIVIKGKVETPEDKESQWGAFEKFREKKVENVPSQFTPKYATFGSDVDIDKYMGKTTGEKKDRTFTLASDVPTASLQTKAAETYLGFSIDPKKDSSEQISDKIAEIAEQNTIEPKRRSYKESADYFKAVSEWEAKVKENEQKIIEGIQAQANALQGQGIAAEGLRVKKAEVFHPDYEIPLNQSDKDKLSNIKSAVGAIDRILDEFKSGKYKPNSPGYEGLKLSLAKEMIIAYDLPVSEGVLNEVKERINTGRDWISLIPNAPKDFIENLKSLRKDMSTEDAVKLGQEAQEKARGKYLEYRPKNMDKFNREFHIYGKPQEKPKSGAARQLEEKGKPKDKPAKKADPLGLGI